YRKERTAKNRLRDGWQRFIRVRNKAYRVDRRVSVLPLRAQALGDRLMAYTNEALETTVGTRAMLDDMGVGSRNTVTRYVDILESWGIVAVVRQRGRLNVIRFNDHPRGWGAGRGT